MKLEFNDDVNKYLEEFNKINCDSFCSWLIWNDIDLMEKLYNQYLDYSIGKMSEVPKLREQHQIDFDGLRKALCTKRET